VRSSAPSPPWPPLDAASRRRLRARPPSGHYWLSSAGPFYSGKHRRHGMNERANAQLKTRGILRKLRCRPWRAGQIAKAIHVLQARETAG